MTRPLPLFLRVRIPFPPIIIAGLLALGTARVNAQIVGEWTWESGANVGGATAVYGVLGVAAAGNVPGNRDSQSGWADAAGNFWVFGGDDVSANTLNDLWKYNPSTGLWTWVSGSNTGNVAGFYGTKGTATATNMPPSRFGQNVAVDPTGNFWVFGGATAATLGTTTFLNDLWKYNPTTNQWTWMSGDNTTGSSGVYGTKGTAATANKPGGRIYPATWSDASGNIWVFGGQGFDGVGTNGSLNDLWEYSPTTGRWTWVSGSNTASAAGVYGTKGVAAAANIPGARNSSSGWRDAAGNFWIFGGSNGAFFTGGNSYNDLWKYTVSSGRWTWVTGGNTNGATSVNGSKGVAAAANTPGARYGHGVAVDPAGNFWLFGGYYGGTGSAYNDLWAYNPTLNEWNWVSGSSGYNAAAVYGTKGSPASANTPSARGYQSVWTDAADNVWVSSGYDGANDNNDLFKFSIVTPLAIAEISLQGLHEVFGNNLSWNTYGENDAAYFSVERSVDGSHFAAIGAVRAVGSGDHPYSFVDNRLVAGSLFYRIRAVGMDGSVVYSSIIVLGGSSGGGLTVFPNPARSSVTLQLGDNSLVGTTVRLVDMKGRVVGEWVISGMEQVIDVSRLPQGMYLLQLSNGTSVKIVKIP
jgi:N-acetylneuraminic acid mutarotase